MFYESHKNKNKKALPFSFGGKLPVISTHAAEYRRILEAGLKDALVHVHGSRGGFFIDRLLWVMPGRRRAAILQHR